MVSLSEGISLWLVIAIPAIVLVVEKNLANYVPDVIVNETLPWKKQNSMFFALITAPQYNMRHNWSYNAWVKKAIKEGKHEAVFVSEPGATFKKVKIIHPTADYLALERKGTKGAGDRNRGMKRMMGLKYFVENTTFDWHWSTCDDVSFDVSAIDNMIHELNERYNPNYDLVFMGHCILNSIYYLQGGIGFIISRAAAKALIPYGLQWVNSIKMWDDYEFYKLRERLGLTVAQTHSPYMVGHYYRNIINETFLNGTHPKCPKDIKETQSGQCQSRVYPIQSFVAYHRANPSNPEPEMKAIIEAKRTNPSLKYYFDTVHMVFCKD